jgi:hypothetical protein
VRRGGPRHVRGGWQADVVRRFLAVVGVLAALVLLAGWGLRQLERGSSPYGQAEAATRETAGGVVDALSRTRGDVHEPGQLAQVATRSGVEVLEATGDRYDSTIELLVRVTTTGYYSGWMTEGENITDVRCYRIVQRDQWDFAGPRERRCPAGATPVPLPPPPAQLPAGFEARLAAALTRLPAARRADPAAVQAAARAALGGSPATVSTARSGRTVGVAVSASRYECVLAAVDAGVDVWRPARVDLEPGESGCTAEDAARRRVTR